MDRPATTTERLASSAPTRATALDWLKAAALVLVCLDHVGYYWTEDDWLRVPGRLAAPVFFYLIGLSSRRAVPWTWLAIGFGLTALDAWSEDKWTEGTVNILLNLALVRTALTWLERVVGAALAGRPLPLIALAALLAATAPWTGEVFEYGTQGWLWALAGIALRLSTTTASNPWVARLLLALAALVTLLVETEQQDFDTIQEIVLALLLAPWAALLAVFRRDAAVWVPPAPADAVLRFLGRHTLEIYAVQIVLFEVLAHV
jgi:hypothetical protein